MPELKVGTCSVWYQDSTWLVSASSLSGFDVLFSLVGSGSSGWDDGDGCGVSGDGADDRVSLGEELSSEPMMFGHGL